MTRTQIQGKEFCEKNFRTLPIIKDEEQIKEFKRWLLDYAAGVTGCPTDVFE